MAFNVILFIEIAKKNQTLKIADFVRLCSMKENGEIRRESGEEDRNGKKSIEKTTRNKHTRFLYSFCIDDFFKNWWNLVE